MMRVGIIGAMDVEVTSIKERMTIDKIEQVGDNTYCLGKIGDTEVVVARCGIGKVNAAICATTMCVKYDVTHIINTGIAGSLDNQINIGDIVVSTDAVYHDFSVEPFGYPAGMVPGRKTISFTADETLRKLVVDSIQKVAPEIQVFEGRVASGDIFVGQKEKKDWIISNFGAKCCEMEGCAIAHVATDYHVPFVIVRAISDKADEESTISYEDFEAQAAEHCANLVFQVLQSL